MNKYLRYIVRRLSEPSTMAGLSVLGVLVGLPPGTVDLVATCVAGVAATIAVVVPEGKTVVQGD